MHLKGKKCSGGKNSKIQLTGLVAANMCREKIPMFVIRKSNKPCCFKGIKNTPCQYHAKKKSWMDSQLFEEWVREQDRNFALEGRMVALLIDNCTAHPNFENRKSIALYFIPPNTTSYGSRSHSVAEEQVPLLHDQHDHKCYIQRKTNAFNLYTSSYESSCSFLE